MLKCVIRCSYFWYNAVHRSPGQEQHVHLAHRRHTSKCSQSRSRHERTYESDELRRGFKKCHCPIQFEGKVKGAGFLRKSTEKTSWDEAKFVAVAWETAADPPPVTLPESSAVPAATASLPRRTSRSASSGRLRNFWPTSRLGRWTNPRAASTARCSSSFGPMLTNTGSVQTRPLQAAHRLCTFRSSRQEFRARGGNR